MNGQKNIDRGYKPRLRIAASNDELQTYLETYKIPLEGTPAPADTGWLSAVWPAEVPNHYGELPILSKYERKENRQDVAWYAGIASVSQLVVLELRERLDYYQGVCEHEFPTHYDALNMLMVMVPLR